MRRADDGFLIQVAYTNPRQEPPCGLPRVLAEMFVLSGQAGCAARVPSEIKDFPRPPGYGICITHVGPPTAPHSSARLSRGRLRALRRRIEKRFPMFAEQFISEKLAANPEYYAGRSTADAQYHAAVQREKELYARLVNEHGQLYTYTREER